MTELENIDEIIPHTNAEVSKTFCMAKWHHTTIYLQTGETHSCYHPAPHPISLEELENNPSALHNTNAKKHERELMMKGKKPEGCAYCWNIEAMGKDYVSDRHIKTASIYNPQRLEEIKQGGASYNVNPEYIELSFSNECNFKCGYCHPKASSRYWKEIDTHGPYSQSTDHRQDIDWFKIYQKEEENPYIRAWWRWWPEVSQTLNILRLTGGEPLMHKSTWELFDKLEADPKPHIQIEINSNMGVKPKLVEKLVERVNYLVSIRAIKNFKLYTSIDTWGKRAEYARHGLDIELWERNLDYYLTHTDMPVTFMITFNIFGVTSFTSLLEKIREWRSKYNHTQNAVQWQRIRFDTPHLKEPTIYDMNILPKEEYMPYMHDHLDYIWQNQDNSDKTKFTDLEYLKFKRVVDYMQSTTYDDDKLTMARKNFNAWFTEHDRRRNTSLLEHFPEMKSFWNLCAELNGKSPVD